MKVYIVMYEEDILEVFDSKELASAYIWDWDRRSKWIDAGWDIDAICWHERELRSE